MSSYFDTVVDMNYIPLFIGTFEEIKKWILEHEIGDGVRVFVSAIAKTQSIKEYLNR